MDMLNLDAFNIDFLFYFYNLYKINSTDLRFLV